MTPQSTFMVVAPIADGRRAELEALLATMTHESCIADPANALVPFGASTGCTSPASSILDPQTTRRHRRLRRRTAAVDGRRWRSSATATATADAFLDELVASAGDGLRRIFAHCQRFGPGTDLRYWMRVHAARPTASYVNWIGRTVRRIREEAALRDALVGAGAARSAGEPCRARSGCATGCSPSSRPRPRRRPADLTPEAPTPRAGASRTRSTWSACRWCCSSWRRSSSSPRRAALPAALARELRPRGHAPRADWSASGSWRRRRTTTSPTSSAPIGDVKPGRFRRWLVVVLLRLLDYASRHVYRARLPDAGCRPSTSRAGCCSTTTARLLFASNYDGSLESYMDDFINKVAWGINVVFGNGVGFPRVSWLLARRRQVRGQVQALPAPAPDPDRRSGTRPIPACPSPTSTATR